LTGRETRSGKIISDGIEIQLCDSQTPESKKLWKQKATLVKGLIPMISNARKKADDDANQDVNRLLHNLKKFNAHCVQISDFFLETFQSRNSNSTQRDSIKRIITSKPDKAAIEILKTIKNIRLIQAEISVFDKLYNNEDIQLRPASHQIHRIVNSIIRIFSDALDERGISVTINDCSLEVIADYETFTVALTHIIDNISKYAMPKSEVRIYFEEVGAAVNIHFAMTSLKINDSEIEEIFEEGNSGYYSTKLGLKGNGIGMFIIKQFVRLNNGEFIALNNVSPENAKQHLGIPYEENLFTLSIPKALPTFRPMKR
jgi:signal transduction histidine kinase